MYLTAYYFEYRFRFMQDRINTFYKKVLDDYVAGDPELDHGDLHEIGDDLVNAIIISSEVDKNKKLSRKIVNGILVADEHWFLRHGKNLEFLEKMRRLGVNSEIWMKGHQLEINGIRFYTEDNPIKVLQMGNYFDTCLSQGREYSYSAVANAVEVNKKVIYAKDNKDNIVGRKLIGMLDNGAIVGFRSYGASGADDSLGLRFMFEEFCIGFAAA